MNCGVRVRDLNVVQILRVGLGGLLLLSLRLFGSFKGSNAEIHAAEFFVPSTFMSINMLAALLVWVRLRGAENCGQRRVDFP
jgi:hypothetical protein